MSTHDPNGLRDTRVGAAWRAVSREEPPDALDDAIRAAARREIGAGPRSTDARMAGVPAALHPERWWWPLAAAATIGAIAIGLLQLSNPDHVGAPGADKTVVSDTPAAPAKAKEAEAAAPAEAGASKPEKTSQPPILAPASAPTSRVVPTAPSTSPNALRKDAAVPFPRDEGAAASAAAKPSALEGRTFADTAAPVPPVAQPFPADAARRESKEAEGRDAAPAAGIVTPSTAPPAETDTSGFASGKRASAPASAVSSEGNRAERAGVTAAMASKAAPRALPAARDQALARESVAGAGSGTADAVVDARAKAAPKLPVPEWIALIRKLRDEGRADEAAKELAAFRTAHADHELLLPPDLRDWKPVTR